MRSAALARSRTLPAATVLLLAIVLLSGVSSAFGATTDVLDRTFGGDGRVVTAFGSHRRFAYLEALAVQPDGRVLAVGGVNYPALRRLAMVRYNEDGTLDDTFGSDGRVTSLDAMSIATGVVLQPDGKIVVVGDTPSYGSSVARFLPHGRPDPSFGDDGSVTLSLGINYGVDGEVGLDPDGRIVAAWDVTFNGRPHAVLARFLGDGSLDPTFGRDGVRRQPFYSLSDLTVEPDGTIVTVGSDQMGNPIAVRYRRGGQLAPSFGDGGVVALRSDFSPHAVTLQEDGAIVVAGSAAGGFGLTRLSPTGRIDAGFGRHGLVRTAFPGVSSTSASDVVIRQDGSIVAGGTASSSGFGLARYLPDGTLDASFSEDGKTTTAFRDLGSRLAALAVDPDGRVVAGGSGDQATSQQFAVARYLP